MFMMSLIFIMSLHNGSSGGKISDCSLYTSSSLMTVYGLYGRNMMAVSDLSICPSK